jgi:hypothetical protein
MEAVTMQLQDSRLVPDGECGIASVHLVAAYFGLEVPPALIEPLRVDGSTLGEIADTFEALGLAADFRMISMDQLGASGDAALLWLPARDSRPGHLWVKLGADRAGSHDAPYVILDASAPGGVASIERRDFAAIGWEGGALVVHRDHLVTWIGTWQVMLAALLSAGVFFVFVGQRWARRNAVRRIDRMGG